MPANTKDTAKTTPAKPATRRGRGKQADNPATTAPVTDETVTDEAPVTAADEDTYPDPASIPGLTDATDATDAGNSAAAQEDTDDDESGGPAEPVPPVSATPAKKVKDPKIMMVNGVLSDFPAGISIGEIADECGLGPTTVDRLLHIMESQGAAVMVPADAGKGTPELWMSGTTRATDVDLSLVPAPVQHCPTCKCGGGYRARSAVSIRRVSLVPGENSDGHRKFAKGELLKLVEDFINEFGHGHIHTATSVTNELMQRMNGRVISSGAVGNNLRTLAASGKIELYSEDPEQFTANRPAYDIEGELIDNRTGVEGQLPPEIIDGSLVLAIEGSAVSAPSDGDE